MYFDDKKSYTMKLNIKEAIEIVEKILYTKK